MSKFNLESAFGDLLEKVEVLSVKITSQSTTLEAQNKKIEDQQRTIENFSSIIVEQKRVLEHLSNKLGKLFESSLAAKSGMDAPVPAPQVSETAGVDSELALLSQNVTVRPHRANEWSKRKIADGLSVSRPGSHVVGGNDGTVVEDKSASVASEKWTVVDYQRKANKVQLNAVQKGENAQISTFQAIKKKKFLHVWSLHPDTAEKAIIEHVAMTCGSTDVKIEKIIPKTKRDYSSFMVGVPESEFGKINNTECWPLNAKFNEWVWFRVPRQPTKSSEN